MAILRRQGVPMRLEEIAAVLELQGERQVSALRRRLRSLADAGQLLLNRRQAYCLPEKLDAVTGVVSAHRDGFGFLLPEDRSEDIYLPVTEMRQLLDGDRVAVRVTGTGRAGRRAGTVIEILERGHTSVVGRYQREHGIGFVVASGRMNQHFLVPDRHRAGATPGQLVSLEITEYPGPAREPQGRITRLLGDPADPRVLTDAAIEMFSLPSTWAPPLEAAARRLGDGVRPADIQGRVDLRDLPLVTIDGEDARDFDDAVYAEPAGEGWRLVVAIADVSHYVQPGDPIDGEARRRGTSVYFPDRVVPMLPEELSNGLCSLRPDVDRLCMVCDMRVDPEGNVQGARFYRAVMHSRRRLTYTEVDAAHRRTDPEVVRKLAPVAAHLEHLYGVYGALAVARERRGALDLDLPETRIRVDSAGVIAGITARLRNDAHRLIEECMIAANVAAARFVRRHRLPTLYRVHDGPREEKLEDLRLFFRGLGHALADTAAKRPREINRVLGSLRDRPDFPMIATAVLRSMSQAVYQPENTGHFGLALPCYGHFTSPIRRYPDLLLHRAIGHILDGGKPGHFGYDGTAMAQLGQSTSMQERRADEATRHVEARCKCLYMRDHVGAELDGVITAVTHFGLFVTLRDLYVDGLIHVTNLRSDYYHLERGGLALRGERTGTTYRLGGDVRVRVVRVDPDEARIDLMLAGSEARPAEQPRRRARR